MTASVAGSALSARFTSTPVTVTFSASSGDFILIVLAREAAGDYYSTVTDSGGSTWTKIQAAPTSGTTGRRVELWTSTLTSNATSFSAAFLGTSGAFMGVYKISGTDGVDVSSSKFQASATAITASTVTPTQDNDLVLSMVMANSATSYTPSAGWTQLTTISGGFAMAQQVVAGHGSAVGPSWTINVGAGSGSATVALKSSSAPPTGTFHYWDGTTEQTLTLAGVWDGSTIQTASFNSIV